MTLDVVSPTAALLDGRYLLTERIGAGGSATVYRAEDTALERTVAIKMIHDPESALGTTERAHTEKAVLASLDHPTLVRLFDAQLVPKRPRYLVMEFVDGPTLAERMATGPLPGRVLARIAEDLASGLAAVHAAGIVHRDVKPSNVLLHFASRSSSDTWRAKLADFGIACTIGDHRKTSPHVVLGTLTYMAPEQLRGADPTAAIDVFSLGLVLLEALTGDPSYPELGTGRAAAVARLAHSPAIPDDLDAGWHDLLERMTRLEPAERPSAQEVEEAARRLAERTSTTAPLSPLPVTSPARAPSAPPRLTTAPQPIRAPRTAPTVALPNTRTSRRRRTSMAVGALAAILLAGTSAAVLLPPGTDSGRTGALTSLPLVDDSPGDDGTGTATTTEQVAVDTTDSGDQVAEAETTTASTSNSSTQNTGPKKNKNAQGNGADNGKGIVKQPDPPGKSR